MTDHKEINDDPIPAKIARHQSPFLDSELVTASCEPKISELSTAKPVLSDELECLDLPLSNFLCLQISDHKAITGVLKWLNDNKFFWTSWKYLKRARRCTISDSNNGGAEILISTTDWYNGFPPDRQSILDNWTSKTGTLTNVQAVSTPPLTRVQYEYAQRYWPCVFHEDQRMKFLSNWPRSLKFDEQLVIIGNMRKALDVARNCLPHIPKSGALSVECSLSRPCGCLIIDPISNSVVAAANNYFLISCKGENPLLHAVICAVDLVAKSQGGGTYDFKNMDDATSIGFYSRKHTSSDEYLCTGFDCYLTEEPCVMCAMALLHSRIRRIYFGMKSVGGALVTRLKLHCLNGINHRFDVFGGVLEEECRQLLVGGH